MQSFKESPEFHFIVGEERRKITIHAGLLKDLSPPLHALVSNGLMKESLSREAVLDDVDEETFIAFCQYVYHGVYAIPSHKVDARSVLAMRSAYKSAISSNAAIQLI
ncbi:hypothetical protein N7456_006414 [Penicillium angulare]|uniref:BTB domain-containing protein n=1 Tax=Penicillium angulare TaxID=116970 RepID=A0A9W9FHM6_9EURO|nr:hypothetical protein N7456_006414 [Penicillium angulare]